MIRFLILFLSVTLLLITACDFRLNEEPLGVELDIPFVKSNDEWVDKFYQADQDGFEFCVIDSGRRGIKVILRKNMKTGKISRYVKSGRNIIPGAFLNLRVNGNHYKTVEQFFSPRDSANIIYDMTYAKKVYLEWVERQGASKAPQRFNSTQNLSLFKTLYSNCLNAL